jgi:hypothetical protein
MKCAQCHGLGMRRSEHRGTLLPCDCVFRAIFRVCHKRFRECVLMEKRISTVTLDWSDGGASGRRSYGRKIEEYIADFSLTGRRILDETQYAIFRYHFLLGADWRLCCRYLKMEKGNFFHKVYRVMALLGREFAETQPYALFPLDEYFGGVVARPAPRPVENIEPARRRRRRLQVPETELLKIA